MAKTLFVATSVSGRLKMEITLPSLTLISLYDVLRFPHLIHLVGQAFRSYYVDCFGQFQENYYVKWVPVPLVALSPIVASDVYRGFRFRMQIVFPVRY